MIRIKNAYHCSLRLTSEKVALYGSQQVNLLLAERGLLLQRKPARDRCIVLELAELLHTNHLAMDAGIPVLLAIQGR